MALAVGGRCDMTIGAAYTTSVGSSAAWTVGGNVDTKVGGYSKAVVGKQATLTAAMDVAFSTGMGVKADVAQNLKVSVAKESTIVSGLDFALTTGGASLTAKKDGTVAIHGKDISIDGSGKVNVKASSDVVIKGSKVLRS
jgi:type VI secretion system secreted protein VgrG